MPSAATHIIVNIHLFFFSFLPIVSWSVLSQPMKQVDTGMSRSVWATDSNQDVYFFNEKERSFEQVLGQNLLHVTSGDAGVCLLYFPK